MPPAAVESTGTNIPRNDLRAYDSRMLIGMADESGFQTGGYFGMAGYLADHDVWAELNPLWNEALKKNGAPYLHMKEPHEVHAVHRQGKG
jgi:hypothetical protein